MLAAPVVLGVVPLQTLQNPAALSLRCPPLRGQIQGREAVVVADILVGSESNVSSVPRMKSVANSACLNPRVNGGDVAAGDGWAEASDGIRGQLLGDGAAFPRIRNK